MKLDQEEAELYCQLLQQDEAIKRIQILEEYYRQTLERPGFAYISLKKRFSPIIIEERVNIQSEARNNEAEISRENPHPENEEIREEENTE